jgi:hypothetical protein
MDLERLSMAKRYAKLAKVKVMWLLIRKMERFMDGWIKIHRKSLDSSIWKNPNVWFVWSWCLMKAQHTRIRFPFNGADFVLEKGSFVTGIQRATEELPGISPQTYRTCINYLKSTGRITTKSTNKFTIISILKWEEYQQQLTSKLTSKLTNHQQTTNKPLTTYNNDKNDEKISINTNDTYGNKLVNHVLDIFEETYGHKPIDKKPRWVAQTFIKQIKTTLKEFDKQTTDDNVEAFLGYYFKWLDGQEYNQNIQNLDTVRRKLEIYKSTLKGKNEKSQ